MMKERAGQPQTNGGMQKDYSLPKLPIIEMRSVMS